jgi:hypothetical protein
LDNNDIVNSTVIKTNSPDLLGSDQYYQLRV